MTLRKSRFWSLVLAYTFFLAALGIHPVPRADATVYQVAVTPKFKAFEPGTGNPLASGKLYTYLPGTTTLTTTYKDYAGGSLNTNPIILDANGECDLYFTGYLKLALYDANNVLVWTKDNIPYGRFGEIVAERLSAPSIGSASYTDNGYFGDLIARGPWVDVRAYGATCDNVTVQAAVDNNLTSGKTLYVPSTCTTTGVDYKGVKHSGTFGVIDGFTNDESGNGSAGIGYNAASGLTGDGTLGTSAFGYLSGYQNAGAYGTFFGYRSGYQNQADYNVGIGFFALGQSGSGVGNNALGYESMLLSTGEYNNAFGMEALRNSGYSYQSAFGNHALYESLSSYTSGFGVQALNNNTVNSAYSNAFGYWSLSQNGGFASQGFGAFSLYGNTGDNNNAYGYMTRPIAMRNWTGSNIWTATGSGSGTLNAYDDFLYPGTGITRNTRVYRITCIIDGGAEIELSEFTPIFSTGRNVAQIDHTNVPVYNGPYICSSRNIYKYMPATGKIWDLCGTIGNNTTTTFTDTSVDAGVGQQNVPPSNMLMIGNFAQSMFTGDAVFGDSSHPLTNFYFGGIHYNNYNYTDNTFVDGDGIGVTLHSMGGRGTNKTGGNFTIQSGSGTGTGNGGDIVFKVAPGSGSSALFNAFDNVIILKGTGVINIPTIGTYADNTAAGAAGLVAGDLYQTSAGVLMRVLP